MRGSLVPPPPDYGIAYKPRNDQSFELKHALRHYDGPYQNSRLFAAFGVFSRHRLQEGWGGFFGRIHVAHHLPDRVYVIMHAVFHPANAFVTAAIIQTPLILMGVSPEATLAASLLIDLQSLVSHFNVDLRAGFLNYIFIGTETHRYHHSANVKDAGNYGNTLAIWDQLFGTFLYRPGVAPERLGVANPDDYPESNELARVLALPFGQTPLTNALHDSSESRPRDRLMRVFYFLMRCSRR